METPLVSICCITYNHEPYIRKCLEGFVMQKTTFPFEVLIHDDASPDHTPDIIREYEKKYPEIIKPILQTVNQYSQGIDVSKFNFNRIQGKYVAMCEGDDEWLMPDKLQKQVEYMESHPECSMCFTRGKAYKVEAGQYCDLYSQTEERDYTAKDFITSWVVPTASMVLKKEAVDLYRRYLSLYKNFWAGDRILELSATELGTAHCLPLVSVQYNMHGNGARLYGEDDSSQLLQYRGELKIFPQYSQILGMHYCRTTIYHATNPIHRKAFGFWGQIQKTFRILSVQPGCGAKAVCQYVLRKLHMIH